MKLKIWVVAGSIFLISAGFIVADYYALFGSSEKSEFVLQQIKFRVVDKLNNSPIIGARIRCFQKGRKHDVCFQRDGGKPGIVSIMIPRTRIGIHSLLFEQAHHYSSNGSSTVHVMLMHLDYSNQTASYNADELFNNPEKIHKIMLERQVF